MFPRGFLRLGWCAGDTWIENGVVSQRIDQLVVNACGWTVMEALPDGANGRALQFETNRLVQRYGRKTLALVYQDNDVYTFLPQGARSIDVGLLELDPCGGQGTVHP